MGVAGLWSFWNSPSGLVYSFAMLPTNGDHLPMMNSMYRSFEEKDGFNLAPGMPQGLVKIAIR